MSEYIVETVGEWGQYRNGEFVLEDEYMAVPATPLVRCKDCKHMHVVRKWTGKDTPECWLHADSESGALGKEPTEPDGFCKWGESRITKRAICGPQSTLRADSGLK